MGEQDVIVEADIKAAPERLYELISDVTRMGEWSPETTSCSWMGAATGPAVGARFRGSNRSGWRRWMTLCRVVAADPGREFSFEVTVGPLPIARWTYRFEPADGAGPNTKVTEHWQDQRQGWMVRVSPRMMGVPDRRDHNRRSMEATLANLKRFAEAESA